MMPVAHPRRIKVPALQSEIEAAANAVYSTNCSAAVGICCCGFSHGILGLGVQTPGIIRKTPEHGINPDLNAVQLR
jgi:hypothetical protein